MFRSEKLRRAVSTLDCVNCGQSGMTQAAHRNEGKGMGIKSSDGLLMALCTNCHSGTDAQNKLPKEERREWENQMVIRTYQALIEQGLLKVAA